MGGRGSSSSATGSSGGIKNLTASKVGKMSDNELRDADKLISEQIALQNNLLAQIARDNPAYNMPRLYYNVQSDKQDLQEAQRLIVNELVKRNKTSSRNATSNTFVNSFGEATKRNITSSSYEKAQKKLNKQIMSFIGG